jgi:hypothetical protein
VKERSKKHRNTKIKTNVSATSGDVLEQQLAFWEGFVEYCNNQGRYDLSSRKPLGQNWYDVPVNAPDFIISYTLTYAINDCKCNDHQREIALTLLGVYTGKPLTISQLAKTKGVTYNAIRQIEKRFLQHILTNKNRDTLIKLK